MAAKSGLKFRRIGRARAFAVMLGMIGVHAAGGFRAALGAACDFIRIAIVYGVSAGAEGLHARYQTAIGEDVSVELHPQIRSEEHTSELQSLMRISYAVFCLKKKKSYTYT